MGSTSLTTSQKNYSSNKLESLAVVFAMENTRFFTLGGLLITVYTDNKTVASMWNKELEDLANARIIQMFDKFIHLNIMMIHKPGKENEGAGIYIDIR